MIESNINELIVFLTETVKQGVMFTQQNIPVWVNEILQYGIFQAWFSIIVELFIIFTGVVVLLIVRKGYKVRAEEDKKQSWSGTYSFHLSDRENGLCLVVITTIVILIFFLMMLVDIHTLIQISKAPMLYLLKTISKLM
jgi:hypothetical protein